MAVHLTRRDPSRQLISLVPMIDAMLILLVFFMVTSTYLNLDMIPMVDRVTETETAPIQTAKSTETLLIRIGANDQTYVRGQALGQDELAIFLRTKLAGNPLISVALLPSPRASTQALVTNLDILATSGATRVRLMQLEGRTE